MDLSSFALIRQAKVNYFTLTLRIYHDILKLKVSMCEVLCMDCIYRFKHLLKEEATDLFVEALSLYHKVTEIYASHELVD